MKLPLFLQKIRAGFPSPAEDFVEKSLDLNEYMIERPAATFLLRVAGDSMKDLGILEHDVLIVDKSKRAKNGDVVVAAVDGDFTVKIYEIKGKNIYLSPANSKYKKISVKEGMEFEIFGVVVGVVRKL